MAQLSTTSMDWFWPYAVIIYLRRAPLFLALSFAKLNDIAEFCIGRGSSVCFITKFQPRLRILSGTCTAN